LGYQLCQFIEKHIRERSKSATPTPLRGWSSHFKGFSMANCRKNTNDIWTKVLHLINKSKVTDGWSNQKRAYKTDGNIFSKWISSLSFQGTTMIHEKFFDLASVAPKNSILTLFWGSQSKWISCLDFKVTHSKPTWICSYIYSPCRSK
jgi:hypothetical protein